MLFETGCYFQSKESLIHCLSEATYNEETKAIEIDAKKLKPNIYSPSAQYTTWVPVWDQEGNEHWVDVRNDDPSRALSIWKLTETKVEPHGCGANSMVNYGHTSIWGRYFCKAKRVNRDGSDHPSGETISFSSSGNTIIKDLTFVRLK